MISVNALMVHHDYKAVLKRMFQILENNGKLYIINVTRLEYYFKCLKYLQDTPEWSHLGKKTVIPDWVQADWEGKDRIAVFKDAVNNAGFTIEKTHIFKRRPIFETKANLAGNFEFFPECNLETACVAQ